MINLKNVDLEYIVGGVYSQSFKNQLFNTLTGGKIVQNKNFITIKALNNLNINIENGQRIGLIGANGAGKTSFLKLIAGIYQPTSGELNIKGKVLSTISPYCGVEPDATGIENIYTIALLNGLKKQDIKNKIDDICDFSELGDYLYMPTRVYSSGMLTRLVYSVITSIDADILVMDEIIGVNDATFIEKSSQRLRKFIDKSKILFLASHSEGILRNVCNKCIFLKNGSIEDYGNIEDILNKYNQSNKFV